MTESRTTLQERKPIETAVDILLTAFQFLPAVAAAYVAFILLRFPDLSIEATWALSGIFAARMLALDLSGAPTLGGALLLSIPVGLACGLITYTAFRITRRQKLLSSLISYFVILSIGYRVLQGEAAIFEPSEANFVLFRQVGSAIVFWAFMLVTFMVVVAIWCKSKLGLKTMIVGETNGRAASVFALGIDRYYLIGLLVVAVCASIGGTLYSLYYGQASNAAGVSLLLKAIFGAFAGERLLAMLPKLRSSTTACVVAGAIALAVVLVCAEDLTLFLQNSDIGLAENVNENDKAMVIGILLLGILALRPKEEATPNEVSDW